MRLVPGCGASILILSVAALVAGACRRASEPPATPEGSATTAAAVSEAPGWVGRAVCAGCHPGEAERWRGSHHDLAMQEASEATVLGDFEGASIEHFGVTSRFARRGGRFFVRTDGADGALAEYEIAYTFGVEPLQQYLVRLPGGRLQALGLAWDTRPARQGGQRWFHLHPDEPIPHDDALHWTAPSHNWNSMCADCHSTGLRKGYDPVANAYETSWQEIDVSCEACHGPGSHHVDWAEARPEGAARRSAGRGLVVDLRNEATWVFVGDAAIAERRGPAPGGAELESCAPCHARRSAIREGALPGGPFLDAYRPALLDEGLYHADGQILEEVYVWGSFLQSRMHAKGVTCSDCHDPHALRIAGDADASCARCHREEVFAAPSHHHHEPGSVGSRCVGCHMPARTYMGVDVRRDHSFRVPRPDLSEKTGAPNTCTGCHADRDAAWAAGTLVAWHAAGRAAEPHYAEALHAGRGRLPGAERELAALAQDAARPAIVRATALRLLREQPGNPPPEAIARGLADADALVRMAAVEAAERFAPAERVRSLAARLQDPVRAVRIEAARVLSEVPPELWPPGGRAALAEGLEEYRAAQRVNADRPEAHLNLGVLHARFGELEAARREYETALRLAPDFLPAYLNLADLYRQEGREDACEEVLRRALERAPESADVSHALGLLRVRQRRLPEALEALARAAALAPDRPRHAYVYGVALHSAGETQRALAVLDAAHRRHPADRDLLVALATISRDAGASDEARTYAARLQALGDVPAAADRLPAGDE